MQLCVPLMAIYTAHINIAIVLSCLVIFQIDEYPASQILPGEDLFQRFVDHSRNLWICRA